MTATQYTEQLITETRRQLDTAAVEAALAHGELERTPAETLDALTTELKALVRDGRTDAARALKQLILWLLDNE